VKSISKLQKVKAMSLEHLVEKLAAFEPQGELPVVSLYLNAQADEHGRHNFLRHQAKDESNLTDSETGPDAQRRRR
jgi:hypothetical protein